MILEIILIAAILGIFILIIRRLPEALADGKASTVRRLPEALADGKTSTLAPTGSKSAVPSPISRLIGWFRPRSPAKALEQSAVAPVVQTPSNATQQAELLSEDSLLAEGDRYLADGKFKEAERAFLRAVAKNPKNPKLYNRLGAIYLKQRSYADALDAFEAARDLDASKASRHYNVALAAWHLQKRAKAREAIAQAILLDPLSQSYQELKNRIEE